jgi:hypothetical protein
MLRASLVLAAATALGGCASGLVTSDDDRGAGPDAGGGGGGGNGGGNGGGGSLGCERELELDVRLEALPPDVFLVVDRSSSMGQSIAIGSLTRKWDIMKQALGGLVEQFATRVHFGLILTPGPGHLCAAGVVDVAPAASNGAAIETMLAEEPGGGTPMYGSLEAARAYFRTHPANPNGRYLILATDGAPTCDIDAVTLTRNSLTALRQAGIKTYVLGYAADSANTLDSFAAAGGTGAHIPAASAAELAAKLEGITASVTRVSCEYALREGPDSADYLTIRLGGELLARSPDHSNGWDYDPATGALTFYGAACDALRSASAEVLTARFCTDVE